MKTGFGFPDDLLYLDRKAVGASSPKKIVAQGTDWRFLSELKKELTG